MQGTISIEESQIEGVRLIAVAGELDLVAAPHLSERLNMAIRTENSDIVVDLSGVSFVDSTGLAVLLNALRRLTRARRRLGLVIGNGAVARAFEVTRLHWTFDLFDDVESAVARSSGASGGRGGPAA